MYNILRVRQLQQKNSTQQRTIQIVAHLLLILYRTDTLSFHRIFLKEGEEVVVLGTTES